VTLAKIEEFHSTSIGNCEKAYKSIKRRHLVRRSQVGTCQNITKHVMLLMGSCSIRNTNKIMFFYSVWPPHLLVPIFWTHTQCGYCEHSIIEPSGSIKGGEFLKKCLKMGFAPCNYTQ